MKRFSDRLFLKRKRKPKEIIQNEGVIETTTVEEDEFSQLSSSSPTALDASPQQIHTGMHQEDARWSVAPDENLNLEDTRWSIAPGKNLNEGDEDDDDIYMSEEEDTMPSTPPSTPETPKTLGKKKKKKKKKRISEGSTSSKKKGKKKKKTKETVSPPAPQDPPSTGLDKCAESNEKSLPVGDTPSTPGFKRSFRPSFFNNSLYRTSILPSKPVLNSVQEEPSNPQRNRPSFFNNSLYRTSILPSKPVLNRAHEEPSNPQRNRPSFFENSLKRTSILPFKAALNSVQEEPSNPQRSQPNPEPKKYKLKDAVNKVRGVAVLRKRISDHRKFEAAFDDDREEKEEAENRQQQQEYSSQLQNYETMLEKEREELSNVKAAMQEQRESMEQLLDEESQKNEQLQLKIQELEEKVENAGEAAQLEELREKNRMLQTRTELLQQKTERQEETICSMLAAESSAMKRSPSASSLNLKAGMEFSSHKDDDDYDPDQGSGFMSIASMPGKAQGELLQLRATLKSKNKTLEEQSRELAHVKQALEQLEEDQGVKSLTSHVENLKNEKQFFLSEIDKLRKELEDFRKREQASKMEPVTGAPTPPGQAGLGAEKTAADCEGGSSALLALSKMVVAMNQKRTPEAELRLSQSDINDAVKPSSLEKLLEF